MKENIVIGIEGMVASGKTSTCIELLNLIPNSIFIDAGEIYRGIVQAIRESKIDIEKIKENKNLLNPMELMEKLKVTFEIENRQTAIYINGRKIEKEKIENAENSFGVSLIASNSNNKELYNFARNVISTYRKKFNIILSARDLITIYPEMTYHVYITANIDERVKRRYNQYKGKFSIEEIRDMIVKRDNMHEKAGYNKLYEKSIKVDITNCKNAKESAKRVLSCIGGYINE